MSKKLLAVVVLAGCAHSGMSETVRSDINAQMETVKPTITECYAKELKLDRKLRGMMIVTFVAAPKTGAFTDVAIAQDDLRTTTLETCVTDAVKQLKLQTPQKSKVSVTYPLDFAPTK
jgi:hypothetical protein